MIYCQNCGNQCADHTRFCPVCGAPLQISTSQQPNCVYYYQQPVQEDKPETALCVLSFFFWIVGVVLYAVNVSTKPVSARAYLKWGLISVAVNIGLSLLVMLIPLLLAVSSA